MSKQSGGEDQMDLSMKIKFEYEGLSYDEAVKEYDRIEAQAVSFLYPFNENQLATIKEFFLKQLTNVKTSFGDSLPINDLYTYLFTGTKEKTRQVNIAYARLIQSLMQRFEPKTLQDHQFGARMLAHLRDMNLAVVEIDMRGRELGQLLVKLENEIQKAAEQDELGQSEDVIEAPVKKTRGKKAPKITV